MYLQKRFKKNNQFKNYRINVRCNIMSNIKDRLKYIQKANNKKISDEQIKELTIDWIIKSKQLKKNQSCLLCETEGENNNQITIHHPIEPQFYKSASNYVYEIFLTPLCHSCHSFIHNIFWINKSNRKMSILTKKKCESINDKKVLEEYKKEWKK